MKLARDLLRTALAVLPELDEDARERALCAVDGFVARPAPSGYLAAMRVLHQLLRASRNLRGEATLRERARARGLMAVAAVEPAVSRALEHIGAHPGIEARLQALAALLGAHRELAARVRRAEDARRPMIERMRNAAER